MPYEPRLAYKKQLAAAYRSINRTETFADSLLFILHPDDIIVDGSSIQHDDAMALLSEVEEGFSWHWADVICMDENKMVYL